MEKNTQIIKRGNEFLEKIDRRPILLVNDIAKLVKASTLIKPQYKSVQIGDQIWMTENLNVDHYRNGDLIPEVKEKEKWANLKTGAWCHYNNDPETGTKYGKLYNWYAVNDPRGLAPVGWHIPTIEEFETLAATVNNVGNALKAVGQGNDYYGGAGSNTSGFSALLAGSRDGDSGFCDLGDNTGFWSCSQDDAWRAYRLLLNSTYGNIDYYDDMKWDGSSVRCVKD